MLLGARCIQRLSRLTVVTVQLSDTAAAASVIHKDFPTRLPASGGSFCLEPHRRLHCYTTLQKYNKKSGDETDSEDENEPKFNDERDSKVVKAKVNSLRADLLLKAALGMARNKIETFFYESKIRVNGQKLSKKSVQLNIGDEIDVIRGFSHTNPSHLVIARVVILSASDRDEGLMVNLRRYKTLLIENYTGLNAFKSSEVSAN